MRSLADSGNHYSISMSRVIAKAKIDVLVVEPIFHSSGVCSGTAFHICDTGRIHMTLSEDKPTEVHIPFAFTINLVFRKRDVFVVNGHAYADGHFS